MSGQEQHIQTLQKKITYLEVEREEARARSKRQNSTFHKVIHAIFLYIIIFLVMYIMGTKGAWYKALIPIAAFVANLLVNERCEVEFVKMQKNK